MITIIMINNVISNIETSPPSKNLALSSSISTLITRGVSSNNLKKALRLRYRHLGSVSRYAQQFALYCTIAMIDRWSLDVILWGYNDPPRWCFRLWMVIHPCITYRIYTFFNTPVFWFLEEISGLQDPCPSSGSSLELPGILLWCDIAVCNHRYFTHRYFF